MPTDLLHPSNCREDALNALAEIRACHGDLRTFVARAFDRLDAVVEELRTQRTVHDRTNRQAEQEDLQEQIDQLSRLASDLAHSVAEHKQLTARDHAQPEEAET
jgi:hypothetical protein